jgi:hypothetical protein
MNAGASFRETSSSEQIVMTGRAADTAARPDAPVGSATIFIRVRRREPACLAELKI